MSEGRSPMDRSELREAYDVALSKIKSTMPDFYETSQEHVARCWYEAIMEVIGRRK